MNHKSTSSLHGTTGAFSYCDELGPEKIIEIYDPIVGLRAILVVDNVAAGPSFGGIRMAADADTTECVRLARAMTLKNAMAGLAHGGGKSIIIAEPSTDADEKVRLIRSFAHAIHEIESYVPGPDMGTDETHMAHVRDVTGRAVGLPREIGGIPLDEIGATGWGLSAALEVAEAHSDLQLDGARVVIQGFGSVGKHAALFLAQKGARLVGVSDSRGARVCQDGFELQGLLAIKAAGGSVATAQQGQSLPAQDLIAVPCDVWIPAARPDVIRGDNVARLDTKVVAQGANIPATEEAEVELARRGVLVLPDFVANAGGVICAAVEYHGGSEAQALTTIAEKIRRNVDDVLRSATHNDLTPRQAALDIAMQRVQTAMHFRHSW